MDSKQAVMEAETRNDTEIMQCWWQMCEYTELVEGCCTECTWSW